VAALTAAPRERVIVELAFGAVIVALLLDALRRYTATSAIALVGALSPVPVAVLVLSPFVLQVVAVAAFSRASPRRALLLTAGLFVVAARVVPFVGDTGAVIALSAVGCLAGATLLSLWLSSRPHEFTPAASEAFALGLILDVARRSALGTLDLAELPGGSAAIVAAFESIVFVVFAALALRRERTWTPSSVSGPLALVAVPLSLVIAELAAMNGSRIAAAAGLGLVEAHGLRATAVGTLAIALGLAAGSFIDGRAARRFAAVSLLGGAAIAALRIPTFSLVGGVLLACGLALSLRHLCSPAAGPSLSPTRAAAALAGGWIAFFAVVLAYYVPYAFAPVLWAAVAALAVTSLLSPGQPPTSLTLRGAAVTVIVLSVVMLAGTTESRPVAASGTLRLMTYNIHFGFDHRQIPSLDAIAETIEAEHPDVVVLQEVMRGSSLAAQHDTLGWLASRLRMTYVFEPTVGDFFGNAVLTRLAVEDHERLSFVRPVPLRHSPRGALLVRVGGVAVIVTHLDEYPDAASAAVREDQLRALLERWGHISPPVIIAGDLNALPESRAIALLTAAGFRDLAVGAGATVPVIEPTERIDYVLAKGLTALSARVSRSTASDHRAVVVDVALPPR
jgi:endonuclease/exonuclease/phosphatase family metal-dependent hydrolase